MDVTTMPRLAMPQPAPVLPGAWTFWADLIVGGTPLGPVQPHDFTFTRVLGDFGAATAVLPLDSDALPPERMLRLWSWRLWTFYAGQPVWCGVPTGIADDGSATVSVTMTELPGYLAKRVYDEYGTAGTVTITQQEQTAIAADIAAPAGDVGVRIVTDPGPGTLRDRSYAYLGQDRPAMLKDLSGVIGGPQFRTEYGMTGQGRPECVLKIGYPRVGGATGLGITVPGTAVGYSSAWDSDSLRTRTFAVGDQVDDGTGTNTNVPLVSVLDRPQPDLPRLDAADSWSGVVLKSTLDEYADTSATASASPAAAVTLTGMENLPPLTGYAPGDDVSIHVTSPLLAGGGLDTTGQLASESVTASTGQVAWTVNLTTPAPAARATLTRRIGEVERVLGGIFRRGVTPA